MKTLAFEQMAEGHHVYVSVKRKGYLWGYLEQSGLNIIDLRLGKLFSLNRIVRFIQENRIDIVHFHLTDATKLLKRIHHKTSVGCVTHLHVHKNAPAYLDAGSCGRVISISSHTHAFYLNEVGVPEEKIHKIYNGTSIHREKAAFKNKSEIRQELIHELGLTEDSILILLSGRFTYDKGQDILVEAAPQILKSYPNAHFLFAGSNKKKKDFFRKVMRKASILGISENVHYLGFRNDMCHLIRGAHIQCVPSRIEPFGLVVIEGMMLETPVVTSGVQGIKDIISSPHISATMDSLTPKALAKEIIKILSNPLQTDLMVEKAKAHALKHFSAEVMNSQVMQIYEKVLEDNRK